MSVSHTLTDAGGNAVTLYPRWNYKNKRTMGRSDLHMLSGALVSYKWETHDVIEMEAEFVTSADAAIINAWWETGIRLFYSIIRDNNLAEIKVVIIANDTTPFATWMFPQPEYYHGKMNLQGQPNAFLPNNMLDDWIHHDTLDDWIMYGDGVLSRESTIKSRGITSSKITANGSISSTPCLYKNILPYGGVSFWSGKTISMYCLLYATVVSAVRCGFNDGTRQQWTYHSGGSAWEWIKIGSFIISPYVSTLEILPLSVCVTNAIGYCNGVLLVWQ
jgi:hypothetical protein